MVKHKNIASSPQQLSGTLRVVEMGGLTHYKFDACAHDLKMSFKHPRWLSFLDKSVSGYFKDTPLEFNAYALLGFAWISAECNNE